MKATHFLPLLLLLSISLSSFSQTFTSSWERQPKVSGLDFYCDVTEDQNKGFTIIASKKIKGNSLDLWIIRFDENGDTLWTKTLGTEHKEIAKKIPQLSDKSYIVLGAIQKENVPTPLLVKMELSNDEKILTTMNS